jgi:hypothetical protein
MASKALCQAQSARLPRVRIAARKSALASRKLEVATETNGKIERKK